MVNVLILHITHTRYISMLRVILQLLFQNNSKFQKI